MLWRKSRANDRPRHEKSNGEAYHQGLASEDISLFTRICMLTDVYDKLSTRRSYKQLQEIFENYESSHHIKPKDEA
jgi:HD-GYP domain-containing protein (c-di-GMP phosphodiesterase class II)